MAKILIFTFILWAAVATFATTPDATSTTPTSELTTPAATSTIPTQVTTTPDATSTTPTSEPTTPAATTSTTLTPEPTTPAATTSTTPNTGTTSVAPATTPVLTTNVPPTGTLPTEGSSVSPETGSPPTEDPNASSSASQAPATTVPPSVCASNPCLGGSTCEERANQTFVCLCLTGDFYIGDCVRGKVFPGKLSLKETFKAEMSNKQSQQFKDTSDKIIKAIGEKFEGKQNGYRGSLVLELRESKTREEVGNAEASIEIVYDPIADITEEKVKETMKEIACDSCLLAGSFAAQDLCDSAPCDYKTTTCKFTDGTFTCPCKEGFASTNLSGRICLECPDGQRYDNTKNKCVSCGYGITGTNCNDNRVLILVIVAPILGALLIIALILLGVLTTKSKKKSSKIEDEDIGKPYHSHSVAKAPLSKSDSNGYPPPVKELTNGLAVSSGAPRIPRATTTSNWESRTNLEMTPSNSRQNLISSGQNSRFDDNQDDMISFAHSQPKNNPYEQIRPTSNPYAQNRSMNPYAQSRGQTNPYYS